jgi:hypothetical protein
MDKENMVLSSLDDVIDAIDDGLDSFLGLYDIQNNKNIISETLGNVALNIFAQTHEAKFIRLNTLFNNERKSVLRKKMYINLLRTSLNTDVEKIKFIKYFGSKINDLSGLKYKRTYITSHYSFCLLSIISQTQLFFSKVSDDNDIYNNYLESCLVPNTKQEKILLPLFSKIGEVLENIEDCYLGEFNLKKYHDVVSDTVSTDSKIDFLANLALQTYDFDNGNVSKDDFVTIFSDKNLNDSVELSLFRKKLNEAIESDDIKEILKGVSSVIRDDLYRISNVTSAIKEYVNKFDHQANRSSPAKWRKLGYSRSYMLGVSREVIQECIKDFSFFDQKKENLASILLSPSFVARFFSHVTGNLIDVATQSKGYGVFKRHGVTGQIRAYLLNNFLNLTLEGLNKSYIFLLKCIVDYKDKDQACKEETLSLIHTIIEKIIFDSENFKQTYVNVVRTIKERKRTHNKGSLYFYLNMFADEENDLNANIEKLNSWSIAKLGISHEITDLNIEKEILGLASIDDE